METIVSQVQGRVTVTILQIIGRINLGNATEIEQKARQTYQDGSRRLVIDLSQVESLTSAGLRAIHIIYKTFQDEVPPVTGSDAQPTRPVKPAKSSQIKLADPSPDIRRVLKIAGFDAFLDIYDTVEEAVASF